MAEYRNLRDHEVLALLDTVPHSAFNEIYNRYWAQLFLHVKRMLNDDEKAKDIVQEVFTKIWERSSNFHIEISLSSYLYTAVRNRVFNQIKHDKIKNGYLESIVAFIDKTEYEADEHIRLVQLQEIIAREILKMPPKMREIFELSRNEYLTHKEIAERLNISEHTVRKQVQRALGTLKKHLNVHSGVFYILLYFPEKFLK